MKRIIHLLAAFLVSFAATAQSHPTITVSVNDPVSFKEFLVVGASAEPLAVYSPYAAGRSAIFNFGNVQIANMKSLKKCVYSIVCENGKIKSIHFSVEDPGAGKELEAFAKARFGNPIQELLNKKDGVLETANYTFDAKGVKANLSLIGDKYASLVMN